MKNYSIIFSMLFTILATAQHDKGISYGAQGGLQFNSAILPDVSLNESVSSILAGDDVVKGTPQLADFKINFRLGGFIKYNDGFGFTMFETNYTPTKIYKEFKINTGTDLIPSYTYTKIDESYSYLDIAFSYNIYLYKGGYFSLGASPAFLLSHSSKTVDPQKTDFKLFTGFGAIINDKMFINIRAELGVNEVYKDSYIHHIMIPVSVGFSF